MIFDARTDTVLKKATDKKQSFASARGYRFDSVGFSEVPDSVLEQWRSWQTSKAYRSPYFHPEYVACVDRVRDDVRVGLIFDDAQELVGIFPYQGNRNCLAEPVGGAINDYHGVIGAGNLKLTQEEIVRLTGASKFQFHAWLDPDESMERYVYGPDQAYVADLSAGAEPFIKEISNQSVAVKRHGQKSRKMMREIGSLRLEIDSKDKDLLDWTIQKKREKYQRTGVVDYFGRDWSRDMLHEILKHKSHDFAGMLSVLYAGDKVVATHFGMRSRKVLHYWFPVYDLDFAKYSPGTELFLQIVRRSELLGIDTVDFGYGYDYYKTRLTNRRADVVRGCVDFNPLRRVMNKTFDAVVSRIKSSSLKEPVKKAVRTFNPGAGQPKI